MPDSTCPVPKCIDSQLTTAASVIGFLTFVYAVVAGFLVGWAKALSIERELAELMRSLQATVIQLRKCNDEMNQMMDMDTKEIPREEFFALQLLLERGHDSVHQIQKRSDIILQMRPERGGWKKLRTLIVGSALKDELTGLLRNGQQVLSETQLSMIQFKQNLLRISLLQINDDQLQRSNALFEMLLDPTKRPDAEKSSPPQSLHYAPSQDSSPDSGDILPTMARPKFQSTDGEQPARPHQSAVDRQTALIQTQIQNAASRRRSVGILDENHNADPLGTLLRARTMPIVSANSTP